MSDIDAVVADAEADFWREKWKELAEELNELRIKRDNDLILLSRLQEKLAAAEEERDAVREVLGTPISGVFTVENVASRMEEAENVGYQCGVQHQEALIESLKCCGNCARDPQVDDECDECAAFATHWIRERPTQKLERRKT